MYSPDNILIFIMVLFSLLELLKIITFYIIDFMSTILFTRVEANINELYIYGKSNFIEDFPSVYSVKVTYKYIYKEQCYESSRLNILDSITGKKSKVEQLVDSVKISNNKLLVYVCPFYPSYSLVFPMKFRNGKINLQLLLSLFILSIGIYFAFNKFN